MKSVLEFVRRTDDGESKSFFNWMGPKWKSAARNSRAWMEIRREVNEYKDLWRVHDKLYDLSSFADTHPGGKQWITLTKGTDITELFEAHHVTNAARLFLPKYFVQEADKPRNSPFTFKKDGFYNTLKERAKPVLESIERGPSTQSKIFSDAFVTLTLILSAVAAAYESYFVAFLAGMCLAFNVVISHNFVHQKDSIRMHFLTLAGFSLEDWRISHIFSHHIFPNTRHDLEISVFEPFFQWLPRRDKSWVARFLCYLYFPVFYTTLFQTEIVHLLLLSPIGLLELIPFAVPTSMVLLGGVSVWKAFVWWNIVLIMGSIWFSTIANNAAHHHPEIFHEGDEPRDRNGMDWGTFQVDTVRDRVEIYGTFPLVIVTFGDHTLHHLFPSIDHYHLPKLYPVLKEVCKEFDITWEVFTLLGLIKGQFEQLTRNYPVSFKTKAPI